MRRATAQKNKPKTPEACRETALRLLNRRPHSVAELRRKLLSRGFSAAMVDELATDFIRLKLLDDEALARGYCEFRRQESSPVGRRKIMQDLRRHGIPPEITRQVLSETWDADGDEGEFERALQAGGAKLRLLRRGQEQDPQVVRIKLCRFLAGRGFSAGICHEAARRLIG
jgi:regulatory protein